MEITKENIGQAISALRKCAEEHKKDVIPTFGIVVSSLCNDVADYLEKIKGLALIEMPSEEEIIKKINECGFKIGKRLTDVIIASAGASEMANYLKSKIVK